MNYKVYNNNITKKLTLSELQDRINSRTNNGELFTTAVSGLSLFRINEITDPVSGLYKPSICVVAQGAKRVFLGDDSLIYDQDNYLITSIHLPTTFQVIRASEDEPYLGLTFELNLRLISQLMADSNLPAPKAQKSSPGMATGKMDLPLLQAFTRLVSLLDNEKDIPILSPIIQREIFYRLLVGEQGARLRQIATAGSQSFQISNAIEWLHKNYSKPVKIDELADMTGMSVSTFHHHFRSLTTLSPLQFQKNLRLQEARRLMLAEKMEAGDAAFEVGYESPSQFSREYSRLFGAPPLKDIKNLSQSVSSEIL